MRVAWFSARGPRGRNRVRAHGISFAGSRHEEGEMGPLATSAILLFGVWDLLLLGRLASRWVGAEAATLTSFLLPTLFVSGARSMGLPLIVASVALAPVFEEILYRDRLLLALRARAGTPVAVVVTSVLFALPHLQAWR